MKDIIVGMFALLGIMVGVVIASSLLLSVIYMFGYSVGWFLHLMIGPDLILGIEFTQLVGLLFVSGAILGSPRVIKNTKAEKQIENTTKLYRGY